jgi:putative peptide zinc metalloprotease protein
MTPEPFTPTIPALRPELVVRSMGAHGPYIVKDPAAGDFYQLGEEEHFLLTQLDGTRSAETIGGAFAERFGESLSQRELEEFVEMARIRGFLQDQLRGQDQSGTANGNSACLLQAPEPRRSRQSVLYWRKSLWDPDRLFTWLAPKLKFLWTRGFLVFSAAAILLAVATFWANRSDITNSFTRALRWETAVVTWAALVVVTTLHESAHGLTCKRYGGQVHEIGFLLLFFQPAFYCNVSDAWLFPEKSKRLWVTFAGAYCELCVWALATLTWRVTDPDSAVNYVALVVMAITGVVSLFNLNPLIKLDGYYLLSDWLELPNLRRRALGYLGIRFRKLWGSTVQHVRDNSARDRRIYWAYGLLAWAYSVWLLNAIVWHVGGALVRRYQGWGFIGFSVLLGLIFRRPLINLLRAPVAQVTTSTKVRLWLKRFVLLCILGAGAAALFLWRTELRNAGSFVVRPVHNADVRAELDGIIQEIRVDQGDSVKQGAPIATLSDRDYRAELRKTKAEVEEKQARLNLLKLGVRPEEIEIARTFQAKAEARLNYATNLLEMDRVLFSEKLISKREFEQTREDVSIRTKEVQETKDKLKLLLAGSRQEEIDATAAELSRLQVQQHYLEDQLQLLNVASPIDGIITTHKLKNKVGQAVKKGDLIATVHAMQTVTAEIAIPEKEIADVKLGQRVVLKAQAYPLAHFEGQVTSIAPVVTDPVEGRTERSVLVTTELDNNLLLLKPEMTGHAKIYCGERPMIDIVMRRLIRFVRVEFWSWW